MAIDKALLRKQRDTYDRLAKAEPNLLHRRRCEEQSTLINRQLGIDETKPDDPSVIRQKRAVELAREIREGRDL